MARPSATDRLGRILAIVPWIAEQGNPLIADVCERFGLTPEELLDDLAVVPLVGLHPYTPDSLIELVVDDDRVSIEYGNCLLYTSPSPRDKRQSRMPSSA